MANRTSKPGHGVMTKRGMRQAVCAFDPDTLDEIRARALAAGHSLAEEVRLLVEWGLETARSNSEAA